MRRIIKNNKEYNIKCEDIMCGECSFIPMQLGSKCKLFDVVLDHFVTGYSNNSGWKRCSNCKESEIK